MMEELSEGLDLLEVGCLGSIEVVTRKKGVECILPLKTVRILFLFVFCIAIISFCCFCHQVFVHSSAFTTLRFLFILTLHTFKEMHLQILKMDIRDKAGLQFMICLCKCLFTRKTFFSFKNRRT